MWLILIGFRAGAVYIEVLPTLIDIHRNWTTGFTAIPFVISTPDIRNYLTYLLGEKHLREWNFACSSE